jgi:hypothetical protein
VITPVPEAVVTLIAPVIAPIGTVTGNVVNEINVNVVGLPLTWFHFPSLRFALLLIRRRWRSSLSAT